MSSGHFRQSRLHKCEEFNVRQCVLLVWVLSCPPAGRRGSRSNAVLDGNLFWSRNIVGALTTTSRSRRPLHIDRGKSTSRRDRSKILLAMGQRALLWEYVGLATILFT